MFFSSVAVAIPSLSPGEGFEDPVDLARRDTGTVIDHREQDRITVSPGGGHFDGVAIGRVVDSVAQQVLQDAVELRGIRFDAGRFRWQVLHVQGLPSLHGPEEQILSARVEQLVHVQLGPVHCELTRPQVEDIHQGIGHPRQLIDPPAKHLSPLLLLLLRSGLVVQAVHQHVHGRERGADIVSDGAVETVPHLVKGLHLLHGLVETPKQTRQLRVPRRGALLFGAEPDAEPALDHLLEPRQQQLHVPLELQEVSPVLLFEGVTLQGVAKGPGEERTVDPSLHQIVLGPAADCGDSLFLVLRATQNHDRKQRSGMTHSVIRVETPAGPQGEIQQDELRRLVSQDLQPLIEGLDPPDFEVDAQSLLSRIPPT